MITLSKTSLLRMENLHPDLQRVIRTAANEAPADLDFMVLEGVRSREQMAINYGKGRSIAECLARGVPAKCAQPKLAKVTWLNNPYASNHGIQHDGFGHAIDIAPYPLNWNDIHAFRRLANYVKGVALAQKVSIVAGADWTKADYPHIELAY